MSGYYIIKSKLTDYVLDCEGGGGKPGGKVIPYDRHGKDNQIWYDDPGTGTIRSKAGDLCLSIDNGQLVVKPYIQGDSNQQWVRDGMFIRNKVERNNCLDILGEKKDKGAKIGSYAFNGGANQSWEFINVGGQPPVTGASFQGVRKFYIVSELPGGKVVDVAGANKNAGAKIVLYQKKMPMQENQLFYADASGNIRTALNHMAFHNSSKGQHLTTQMAADPRAQWRVEGNKITNGLGEVLDVKGNQNEDGAELCSYDYKGQPNQHWRLEYV